jgi:hypothetical protein
MLISSDSFRGRGESTGVYPPAELTAMLTKSYYAREKSKVPGCRVLGAAVGAFFGKNLPKKGKKVLKKFMVQIGKCRDSQYKRRLR